MANRLGASMSPYLQQHSDNPVDWWEWGAAAFEEARSRDVPVLLSVGYAACHWCHVMAHESFEDPATAALINEHFVAIKVDREERPDIDALYMRATQMMSGRGGWPMTVFLDADGRPFHAGTYYPAEPMHGMPSFTWVLTTVASVWRSERGRISAIADRLTAALTGQPASGSPSGDAEGTVIGEPAGGPHRWLHAADGAVERLRAGFDERFGGFGAAPKFPPSMVLEYLLRHHARTGDPQAAVMADRTLTAMARGGLYDQVGGGFARYSTDERWLVPHFEKMLYDNALLSRVYLHWWRSTGSPLARRIAEETADFLITELGTAEGGFASAIDADSDPVESGQNREGAFSVWTPAQVAMAIEEAGLPPKDAETAVGWLAITEAGTFERGSSVPQLLEDPPDEARWRAIRAALAQHRSRRPAPSRDDKVVLGWNGLAIAALAEAGLLLQRPDLLTAARRAAALLVAVHGGESGWIRVSRDGQAGTARAVLEDLGGLAEGLLTLYQATGETEWLTRAADVLDTALREFTDQAGGFWDTADTAEPLLARLQDPADNATPSGWTLVTGALLTHAALTGRSDHRQAALDSVERLLATPYAAEPRFFGWAMAVVEAAVAGPVEVAIIGEGRLADELHREALSSASPGLVIARSPAGRDAPALVAGRTEVGGRASAYVCRDFTCRLPTSDPVRLADEISRI